MERFPAKLFSFDEVNFQFIDIHSCIGSISIVFHNKNTMYFINATTTVINTCKKLFDFDQTEVISFFTYVTNKREHSIQG